MRSTLVSSLLVVALIGAPTAAYAGGDASLAEALFQEGKRLMAHNKFADACPKLAESYRLDPGGGTLLSVAYCHEKEGKLATAWAEYKDAEVMARKDGRADREKIAREHTKSLEPKLQTLTVTTVERAPIDGFDLKRNGTPIGVAALGTPFPVDPGEHVFVASAPGKKPWTTNITIRTGVKSTALEVPRLADEPKAAPAIAPVAGAAPASAIPDAATSTSGTSGTTKIIAFGAIGLGIVAVGVGGVFALKASSNQSDADDKCPDKQCTDPAAVKASEDADSAATIANIAVGVGLVAAAVGVVLLVTAPSSSAKTATTTSSRRKDAKSGTIHLEPLVSPGFTGGGARIGGTF